MGPYYQFHTKVYPSILEEPTLPIFRTVLIPDSSTYIAVSSIEKIKRSFNQYLSKPDDEGIFFAYKPNDVQIVQIRVMGGVDYQRRNQDYYFFLYKGLRVESLIANSLFLYGDWWAGHFTGDRHYYEQSPLIVGFRQPDNETIYIDHLTGSLYYGSEALGVSFGRGKFHVGNDISGSVILNDEANDFGYFKAQCKLGTLKLEYVHGALTPDKNEIVYYQPQSSATSDSSRVDKFIVMHKLSWEPVPDRFEGFIGEEIIYGNRSVDLNYILPHAFWRIIEHNLEDRDNVLIFGGFNWKFKSDFSLYHNLLLDEFSKSKILTDWWGSKYALQAGLSYCRNKQIREKLHGIPITLFLPPRINIEMTAVRPWTYTHFIRWNKFSNDGIALGYPLGSNCLNYSTEIDYWFNYLPLSLGVNASYTRQGSTGNSFTLNTSDPALIPNTQTTKTHWLAGKITDTTSIKAYMELHPLTHHYFRIGTMMNKTQETNWKQDFTFSYRTEF
ncbi:MAG TPA: hypothetical protein PLE74_00695 [Candidatus Cloacimonadota bacterium]|nr:hypothetical protein [Candidatus Cloacimonadota bacterium]